jgi:hypothetical protein
VTPPFCRYADTHDSIGCADLTIPEEEARSCKALARALGTPSGPANVDTTDETAITRSELAAVRQRFPTPPEGTLSSPEPEVPGYHLLHQTSGEVCNDEPLTQAEVNRLLDALPERAASPSPGPLPTRLRYGAAEVVAGSSSTVEGPAAHACPGSAAVSRKRE